MTQEPAAAAAVTHRHLHALFNINIGDKCAELIQLTGLTPEGLGWLAMLTNSYGISQVWAYNTYVTRPDGIFLIIIRKNATKKSLDTVAQNIVRKINSISHDYKFPDSKSTLIDINKSIVNYTKDSSSSSSSTISSHILCKCMEYGKYLPYVEKRPKSSTTYFLCEDCYQELDQVSKLLYIESSSLLKPSHTIISSSEREIFNARMRSICTVISNSLNLLKVEFIAVGHALYSDCNLFLDLNVLNVNVNLRGQQVGSSILKSFRSFGNTNNHRIRITMSNCFDELLSNFYMKNCKLHLFLIDFEHMYDDGSFPLFLSSELPDTKHKNMTGIFHLVTVVQRFQFYCRFENKNDLELLHYSIYNCMLSINRESLLTLCLNVLNTGICKEDVPSYLDFVMSEESKQHPLFEGIYFYLFMK